MDRKIQGVCWASAIPDIPIHIFSILDVESILSAARVCRAWNSVARHPECWDFVHLSQHKRFLDNNIKETAMPDYDRLARESACIFRYAGVRAKSISVHPEADDTMLQKIAERFGFFHCSRGTSIESISLRDCKHISAAALTNLFRTCKHLKLIDLKSRSAAAAFTIEGMGRSCPDLVSINLSGWRVTREIETAIGTCMPKLKWLCIKKASSRTDTLCSILDSCTELEYVSVEHCRWLYMRDSLRDRAKTILEFNYSPRNFPRTYLICRRRH